MWVMLPAVHVLLALVASAAVAVTLIPSFFSLAASELAAGADPGVASVVAGLGMMAVYVGLRSRRRR
jgi:hypothetical protein